MILLNEVVTYIFLFIFQNAKAIFTFTYDSIKKNVISSSTTGRFTDKEFLECLDKCRQASSCIFNFYRDVVKRYAKLI